MPTGVLARRYAPLMTALALVFASIAALLHVLFFKLESLDWKKPKTWKTFGLESQAQADTTASLAFNQGFYNLFLAIVTGAGLVLWGSHRAVSVGLVAAGVGSMLAAALVLILSDRRMARAAAIQGTLPLLAILGLLLS